ncbi:MAG: type II toxin-antitoxin system VapC family toxin [Dethiobacter sp.]|nr:type II toxin-antitoxin system VapC family toxin [Dethiobacter sp.]MBS3899724.1 type II toxin-antitoxin system VapC family toxin [Dethiobacter sp.]
MKGAVVDASVSLKWLFNDEVGVSQAQALRDSYLADPIRFPLFAPSLWRYEVANGLAVAARRGLLEHDLARDALMDLLTLGVKVVETESLRVLDLALTYGIAVYDAAYLAVAEETSSILWTADRPFYGAMQGKRQAVCWIEDWTY